ncbi:MAG: hypothetical protein FWD17_09495 [Polyangiaceae bacterium]|nr:hypothetical protein [Polyangiaceae bacterium]
MTQAAVVLFAGAAWAQSTPAPASVSIDPTSAVAPLSPIAVGVNTAVWDTNLLDAPLPGLLSEAGVRAVRYPGGSTANVYHWQSNTTEAGQSYASPSNTFDAFMGVVAAAGARAIVTVNYGSGTPEEAAGWVQYANRGGPHYAGPVPTYPGGNQHGNRYGVQYWEIGNEIYGNGTYYAAWEYDVNGLGPSVYADNVLLYASAMKGADPDIKVGAVLTAPGNWPDGQIGQNSSAPWNTTVLSTACSAIDFVVLHWYPETPGAESDPGLLAAPEAGENDGVNFTPSIPSMVASVRAELEQYCGAHAADVEILVTEMNSVSYNVGKQTTSLISALFLADSVPTWLESGVTNVDWWDLHEGPGCTGNDDASLYGDYAFGDHGMLSNGDTCGATAEPPADTPFPPYFGLDVLGRVVGHGGTLVQATSSASFVSAHAVEQSDGLSVLLVNKDPSAAYAVSLSVAGTGSCEHPAQVWSYGEGSAAVTQSVVRPLGGTLTVNVAPYSITAIDVR